jgi:hypothetical protein
MGVCTWSDIYAVEDDLCYVSSGHHCVVSLAVYVSWFVRCPCCLICVYCTCVVCSVCHFLFGVSSLQGAGPVWRGFGFVRVSREHFPNYESRSKENLRVTEMAG